MGVKQMLVQVGQNERGNEAPPRGQNTEYLTEKVSRFRDVLQDRKGEDSSELPIGEWETAPIRLHQGAIASRPRRTRQRPRGEIYPHIHPIAQDSRRELS
jgi:hypothetical protein